jgi:PAS domain S-box-containing protein
MSNDIRDSGVGIIGRIPWGMHMAYLFSERKEYHNILYPYLGEGLHSNEMCVWIYGPNTNFDNEKALMSEFVDDVDSYIESGQLLLVSYKIWYMKDDTFLETRVNSQWTELLRDALSQGLDGVRAAADITWTDEYECVSFSHYEDIINKTFAELPFIALCLYNVKNMDTFETAEVIRNHSYIITMHDNKLRRIENVELLTKVRQLNENKLRYRKLIEILPDSVLIHDDKKIYFSNDAASQITGTTDHRKLKLMSVMDFVPAGSKKGFGDFIKKSLREDQEHYYKCKFKYQNGYVRDVGITTARYNYHGKTALLSVMRDNTPFIKINELEKEILQNKKLLDETLEYDRIKTEFLSNISHEFRTPLNVILSAIQLVRIQKDQALQNVCKNKYFIAIQQNCYRLLRLINNLIDITKIDSDFYEIKLQNYDIIGLIKDIVASVGIFAENKSISVAFTTNVHEKVMACDPDQIERIILNLLSNAVKFTSNGGKIGVDLSCSSKSLKISVKDSGIGIPVNKQRMIFERFHQVDKSLRKQSEGSGIGLSLVEALVAKHKGVISVSSEPGKGSEFIVDLPIRSLDGIESESHQKYSDNTQNHIERINVEFSDIYL